MYSGAMDPVRNPYSPGAGTRPPALVGRDRQLVDIDVALQRLLIDRDGRGPTTPLFGPLLTFGSGGTFAELYADRAFRVLPLTDLDVHQLGINIPIAPTSRTTFTFHTTGKAGMYEWQCFDPCGSDPGGWGGAMATAGYMKGTVMTCGSCAGGSACC